MEERLSRLELRAEMRAAMEKRDLKAALDLHQVQAKAAMDLQSLKAEIANSRTKTDGRMDSLPDSKSRDEPTDQDVAPIDHHLIAD